MICKANNERRMYGENHHMRIYCIALHIIITVSCVEPCSIATTRNQLYATTHLMVQFLLAYVCHDHRYYCYLRGRHNSQLDDNADVVAAWKMVAHGE